MSLQTSTSDWTYFIEKKQGSNKKNCQLIETIDRIIKLIKESNPHWSVTKDVGCSQTSMSNIWYKYQRNRVLIPLFLPGVIIN